MQKNNNKDFYGDFKQRAYNICKVPLSNFVVLKLSLLAKTFMIK